MKCYSVMPLAHMTPCEHLRLNPTDHIHPPRQLIAFPGCCLPAASPCEQGKGNNTFTSGFEGAWTDTPNMWTNDYFHNLLDFNWTVHMGPGRSTSPHP